MFTGDATYDGIMDLDHIHFFWKVRMVSDAVGWYCIVEAWEERLPYHSQALLL